MKKITLVVIATLCLFILLFSINITRSKNNNSLLLNQNPEKDGYVPNEKTAMKVAEAIWLPIYGEQIYNEKPFHATLKNDSIWIVEGTLPEGTLGGTAYIEIQRKDCKVLKVIHGK